MSGKLRFYKDKLEGYKKFYSIVKTIKMVTMAKYRQTMPRVKSRDLCMRYTEKCFKVADYNEDLLLEATKKTQLFVPISSNRGSCGALNSNTNKYIESVIGPKNVKLMTVGKRGNDSLSKLFPAEYQMGIIHDMKVPLSFTFGAYIYENTLALVPEGELERTQIVYSRYVSAGAQRQTVINIPSYEKWSEKISESATSEKDKENNSFANALLSHEEETIRDFYDFHASLAFTHAVLENELSEYAARIVAVEGQMTNIMQLQNHTNYLYNKTRQGSITASLIEILSALSAMEGNAAKGVKKKQFWAGA